MKKKVKFGRDLDKRPIKEAASLEAMEPFSQKGRVSYNLADSRGEENEDGLSKKETKQHDAVASSSTRNLTIRLKIPKGAHLGEGDSEKEGRPSPDATLLYMNIREISRSDCSKKHEATSMDSSVPTCQIEGCTADLSCANSYFRRNKVCQSHFKATKVEVGNSEQRFCQQCNRFHVVAEFDEGKRSCRLTLAGHNNRRKRSQPEATSVLSSGTLVYLPGKVRRGEKSAMHADPFRCEDLERTVTNEETSDTDNNLRDDASSGNLLKEKSCRSWGRLDPIARQSKLMSCKYTEIPGKARLEQLGQAHSKGEGALLEPMSNAATSFYKNQCIKNSGGNKKKNISSHVTSINMCQVEGCMINLSNTKDYFRRRKVCERHFKATKVKVKNVEQRFCQQCSRFHVLAEFDEGRKSCKKMLMGHNMRRRKAQPETMSRMRSKNSGKDDYDNLKGPQAHIQKKQPMVDSGFETSREENQPL